ncbi:hypothetical protein [Methylorubrum sp. SB2]|uniref:hypothetical protein n=1 Tax=Methylorubrum subtropicum TaxID=3138812 RepID=UPI00313EEB59
MADQVFVAFEVFLSILTHHFYPITVLIAVLFGIQDNLSKAYIENIPDDLSRPLTCNDFNVGSPMVTGAYFATLFHTGRVTKTALFEERVSPAMETSLLGLSLPIAEHRAPIAMCLLVLCCLTIARFVIVSLNKRGSRSLYRVQQVFCPVERRFRRVDIHGADCSPDQLRLNRNHVLLMVFVGLLAFLMAAPLPYL